MNDIMFKITMSGAFLVGLMLTVIKNSPTADKIPHWIRVTLIAPFLLGMGMFIFGVFAFLWTM